MELGKAPRQRKILADFAIVDLPSNYNAILGRPIISYHYCMKFPTPYGIGVIHGDQAEARACNVDLPRPHIRMLRDTKNV